MCCFNLSKYSIHIVRCFLVLCILASAVLNGQNKIKEYPPFMFTVSDGLAVEQTTNSSEIAIIIAAQKKIDRNSLNEIRFWNAAYPSYRWHQIMVEAGERSEGVKNGGRMAILHLAIYDALAEVWKLKQENARKTPFQEHQSIDQWIEAPSYSTFICERSAVAGAAHAVIGHYFPEQKAYLDSMLQAHQTARLITGLQYPSDLKIGVDIGSDIAAQYIAYAKTDRTDQIWKGSVPKDQRLWSGTPSPYDPMKRQWKPFTLKSADQFRPAPPPTDWTADMEELREFNKNNSSSSIAWKWKSEPIWDITLERKILVYGLNAFEAAQASALFHTARFDATIAAWDGKYHYWGIRPFQYDPDFKPILIDTPNFPGYPAGHTTVAGSLATVLSYLFPKDTAEFEELALECSESRFEGGVHFRTDNVVGLEVGAKVGQEVIEVFRK